MKWLRIVRGGMGGKGRTWRGKERLEGKGGMGRGRKGKGEGCGRGERVEKGEGGLDLYICPGAPEFLVTPQSDVRCGVIFMLHPTESV